MSSSSGSGGGKAAKGGHIDFIFLALPLTRLPDPLLSSEIKMNLNGKVRVYVLHNNNSYLSIPSVQ